MDIAQATEQELCRIHQSRNRMGYYLPTLTFIFSLYLQREKLVIDTVFITGTAFMLLGTFLRYWVGEFLFEKWKRKVKWVQILNLFTFFILGASWGLHFFDVFSHYGAGSENVFYLLIVIAGFITGASNSLVAHRPSYVVYVSTLIVGELIVYFFFAKESYIIFNIILFFAFSYSTFKLSHQQLRDLIASQLRSVQENERLNGFINTVPGFVGLMDKNLVIYMANQATVDLYPGIIGRKIGDIDPHSEWEKFIIDFMSSDKKNDISEHHTLADGKDLYALLNVTKTDDGGAIIVSIITTELVQARNKIREQEAKAEYSTRLVSLGQMAAGIAHEVNNPLAIIQGSVTIIKKLVSTQPMDVDTIKTLADKVVETTNRIAKIIKSLKTLSRDGAKDPMEKVSIERILELSLDISGQKFKQNQIELKLPQTKEDLYVFGREVQLSQVMINLLSNAVDAVKTCSDPWVEIRIRKGESWIDLLVIDSGPGVPGEIQEKIMEPFFTTKDVNQGTGLGLSISKSIMREHKGELNLLPEEANTTFLIRFPVT